MCVCVVCDVGMEMDVLPKLHDRLWLLVATTHTPPPQVNEAFAAQYLAVEKDLGLDRAKTNVNGGAIALGHPLAASGSGITAHLVHEMKRRNAKYSIGSACIGGGQGIAILCALMGGII